MISNNDETFREYTEKRIESYQKIFDLFPEYTSNINLDNLKNAYAYEDHMVKVKIQLEKFFGRELNWQEVDFYSALINQYSARSIPQKIVRNMEDHIDWVVLQRMKFCELIGLNFSELDIDEYRKAVRGNIENNEKHIRNFSAIDNNK